MDDTEYLIRRDRSLMIFLIERFLAVISFIFIWQQISSLIMERVIRPFAVNILQFPVTNLSMDGKTIQKNFLYLIIRAFTAASQDLPDIFRDMIDKRLDMETPYAMQFPDFISKYGDTMKQLYQNTFLVFIILIMLFYSLPYIIGIWWYCRCVFTKLREIQKEDARMKAEFDRRRNLLFSDITHDIKTPITTIVGYSRAMADGMITDPDKQQEYLEAMYSKSLRISELITLLFEFVKLDSDGFSLHRETCDLAELVRTNVIMLLADFDDKEIELDIDIPEDYCPAYVDKTQMSRVVTNLLTNAIRYIADGHHVEIKMNDAKKEGKEFYRISVADDGLPIEEEFAKHIFEPFSRSDKARQTTSGGSGLGLSIAHKVAGMHGGELTLDLNYGNGYAKAFQILVPKALPEETE